jgi:alpha-glucosidase
MKQMKWWQRGVIYQIYPRSFAASKGQAVGDLKGITKKLDYLKKLGIDAIWISPFFASPMKDYGYDVANYTAIDPMFGTMKDFDELLASAHKKGLKIIIDQVYNHSSDQHAWFQESKKSKTNPKADWYVWAEPKADGGPPNNWLSIFGGVAWTWNSARKQYYLHQFLKEQPDINFNNPKAVAAILKVTKFWLEKGVDGFRLDTVNFYTQDKNLRNNPPLKNINSQNPQSDATNPYFYQKHLYDRPYRANFPFLEKLRALSDKYQDKMYMGEIGDYEPLQILKSYTKGTNRLHTAYTFILLEQEISPKKIADFFDKLKKQSGWPCLAFSNHDVVRGLSRLTNKKQYYEPASKMLISLLCSLRGTPCLYQGEELGLPEAEIRFEELQDPYGKTMWPKYKGRDGCRTPMPWNAKEKNAGFSKEKPWLPINDLHNQRAAKQQEEIKTSTLCFTREFLAWRKKQPAIYGDGAIKIKRADKHILIFSREAESQKITAIFHFGEQEKKIAAKGNLLFASSSKINLSDSKVLLPAYSSCFIEH